MRTIRFRGKRMYGGEWVYGCLVANNIPNGKVMAYILTVPKFAESFDTWKKETFLVDPATVGQFTGLTDRNGEEIYEGDILAIEGIKYPRHYIVSWNTEKLMFCIGDTPLYALLEAGNTTMREYIVCGNIHDNHKLLKDEKD